MSLLVCIVPVCPVRSGPSHRSEQISQLLFGEMADAIESNGDFLRIRCSYDGYEGWCQASQVASTPGDNAEFANLLSAEWITEIQLNGKSMQIPFGSSLSLFNDGRATIDNYEAVYTGEVWNTSNAVYNAANLEALAYKFLNTSYLWGGKSVFGVDCSGFCQTVFKFFGIALLRDAWQQATQGDLVGFLQESRCGDLAFFDNAEGKITHVGILLNGETIIHSSGRVRIDPIDSAGIINTETGQRTHQLRVIKRIGK
jgi:cell wall-associated NlpC family hydrolase